MKLKMQKRLAANILKVGLKRVVLDPSKAKELKEAITKADIRSLISKGSIKKKEKAGHSRARARKTHEQRVKGRRRGPGNREGAKNARTPRKREWMSRIRAQRIFLKKVKNSEKITNTVFKKLYLLAKGGSFRSKNHLKLYMEKEGLLKPLRKK